MGEYLYQLNTNFRIKQGNFNKALETIKQKVKEKEDAETNQFVKGNSFAFVKSDRVLNSVSLGEALLAFRWLPSYEIATGDIDGIEFKGEKIGSESDLFEMLAPFVESGSYIEAESSDCSVGRWRWFFDGQTVEVQDGEYVFKSKRPE